MNLKLEHEWKAATTMHNIQKSCTHNFHKGMSIYTNFLYFSPRSVVSGKLFRIKKNEKKKKTTTNNGNEYHINLWSPTSNR